MAIVTRQANFLLPEDLTEEVRRLIPKRELSKFVAEAIRKELKRLQFRQALEASFGAWRDEDHPELTKGTDAYVRTVRKSRRSARMK
jgi:hypothetical protein